MMGAEMKTTSKGKIGALERLMDEVRALFHRLRIAVEEAHGQGSLSGGLRGVLLDLERNGPRTVPQMARKRSVSRQHIQVLANRLVEEGLVEFTRNPSHKRSNLVRLTAKGKGALDAMLDREQSLMKQLAAGLSKKELRNAAATLRAVRELFESAEWRQLVES